MRVPPEPIYPPLSTVVLSFHYLDVNLYLWLLQPRAGRASAISRRLVRSVDRSAVHSPQGTIII